MKKLGRRISDTKWPNPNKSTLLDSIFNVDVQYFDEDHLLSRSIIYKKIKLKIRLYNKRFK